MTEIKNTEDKSNDFYLLKVELPIKGLKVEPSLKDSKGSVYQGHVYRHNTRTMEKQLLHALFSGKHNEADVALFIYERVGNNQDIARNILDRLFRDITKNPHIDSTLLNRKKIESCFQRCCENKFIEIEAHQTIKPSKADIQSMRLMVATIMREEVGTILDKMKEAAFYLKSQGIPHRQALQMIIHVANHLLEEGLLQRANLPKESYIDQLVHNVYIGKIIPTKEKRIDSVSNPSLSITQTLPIENLRDNPWFIENRPDLIARKNFDGVVSTLKPDEINVSVPNPMRTADYLGEIDPKKRTPADKGTDVPDFYAPMLLPEEWAARHINPEGGTISPENITGNLLVMNCGWFNVFPTGEGTLTSKERINPHLATGTFPLGPVVVGGQVLAEHTLKDKGQALDAITFRNGTAAILTAEEMANNPLLYKPEVGEGENTYTINGFRILVDGKISETPENNNPNVQMPRSGIGIKEDGSLVFCVMSTGEREEGINAKEFAQFFKSMGCVTAINLDNSGSVGMAVIGRQEITDSRSTGTKITSGSDIAKNEKGEARKGRKNRPIPLALVISAKPAKKKSEEI